MNNFLTVEFDRLFKHQSPKIRKPYTHSDGFEREGERILEICVTRRSGRVGRRMTTESLQGSPDKRHLWIASEINCTKNCIAEKM